MNDDARLNEHDKNEWRDVCRLARPDWTEDQFEEAWCEFVAMNKGGRVNDRG
jgi:hypothetical protein